MSECFMYSFSHPSSGSRKKPSFYAVAVGRQRGIYSTWKQCSEQVTGFRGAVYKGFRTLQDAREFLEARPVAPSNSREERLKSLDVDMDDIHSLADFEKLTEEQRNRMGARLAKEADASAKRLREAVEEAVVLTFGDERNDPRGAAEVNARYMEKLRSRQQVVYVDGACRHNGTPNARAGYGGYYGDGDARNFALPVPLSEAQTNNRGELRATIHAIVQAFVDAGAPRRALAESHTVSPDWNVRNVPQLIIYTDSRYVIDGLTRYSQRWVQNGFILATKQPVLNQDLWKQLIRLRDAYNNRYSLDFNEYHLELTGGYNVHNTRNDGSEGICLKHVKGHSNVHGNEMADSLAVEGAMKHRAF